MQVQCLGNIVFIRLKLMYLNFKSTFISLTYQNNNVYIDDTLFFFTLCQA